LDRALQAAARLLPVLALTGWLLTAGLAWLVRSQLQSRRTEARRLHRQHVHEQQRLHVARLHCLALFGEPGLAQATYAQLC